MELNAIGKGLLLSRFNVCALLSLGGFALSVLVFYPGLFTPDSLVQFDQAQSGLFTDWHPPAMAALWRLFNFIYPGPALLFLFHLSLFWGGAFAIGDALGRRGIKWTFLFPLIGLLPFVFNYLGLLWKDVALASAWLFAVGWTFHRRAYDRKAHPIELAAIWLVFLYGALVRSNSIFAAAPLALYLVDGNVLSKKIWPQIAACIIAPALLIGAAHVVNTSILHAEHEHAEDSIYLFDLAGISHALNRNIIPGPWPQDQAAHIPNCYHPDKWDWLGEGDCAFIGETYDNNEYWGEPFISKAWRAALLAHPREYLGHRIAFTNQLLRVSGPIPAQDAWMHSEMRDPRYAHHPGAIFRAYETVCDALQNTPLFRPITWLLLSCVALVISIWRPDAPERRFASALAASAILYLLTYVPFGVASDFRYAYWSILAAMAASTSLYRPLQPPGASAAASAPRGYASSSLEGYGSARIRSPSTIWAQRRGARL